MAGHRKHEEEHENEERWLLTYADLITLLMAFFVVMYALSRVDVAKFDQLSVSLREAFNTPRVSMLKAAPAGLVGSPQSRTPTTKKLEQSREITRRDRTMRTAPAGAQSDSQDPPSKERGSASKLRGLRAQLESSIQEQGLDKQITVSESPSGRKLFLRFADSLFFDTGSAQLTTDAQTLLDKLEAIIAPTGMYVGVEGHTDNVPIQTSEFPSNWHLSTSRAMNVVLYMVNSLSFPPTHLSAAGYGEFRPIAENAAPEGRAKNRRVEFVISDDEEADLFPSNNTLAQSDLGDTLSANQTQTTETAPQR